MTLAPQGRRVNAVRLDLPAQSDPLAAKARKAHLARKVPKVQPDPRGPPEARVLVHKVPLEHKDRKVPLEHKVHKDLPVRLVLMQRAVELDLKARLVLKALLEIRGPMETRVLREIRVEQLGHKDPRACKVLPVHKVLPV